MTIDAQIKKEGFFNYELNEVSGEVLLDIPVNELGKQFLYVNSMTSGVGSNDLGLDRGQLGDQRVVYFYKSGNKLLLIEENLKFRAISDNIEEYKAVDQAFAKSVIWGFKIKMQSPSQITIDISDFLINDAHGIVANLTSNKQGQYKLDKSKSGIYPEGFFNFPKNTEFEAIVSYVGSAKGEYVKSVVPSPNNISVRLHHSFIELPDDGYEKRNFHPESGFFNLQYADYATPIEEDLVKRFIYRHRLKKKNPNATSSEAVEPIIYYLDRGCPEPIRSALIDGAKWWNEAFEAAGFINAFQVKDLPENAHPMDVRYNLIQWVHRSTRGWSYGSNINDPRTGEILKGHVSLGSLRVRQDYLIAQGILSSFDEEKEDPRLKQMALARLRQLSAHEVGHTIGLAHNFAASYNDRASVMDYPHPMLKLTSSGDIEFDDAYDVGIGDWDKRTIIYGYGYPKEGETESAFLDRVIQENRKEGFKYITDQDARPKGGLHPYAHLWDNGSDPIGELHRISELRKHALSKIGSGSIPKGLPYSEIEKVLVPVYLMHRYQIEAVSKLIGGVDFSYDVKTSDSEVQFAAIEQGIQERALKTMLTTVDAAFLKMPENVLSSIPPPAFGYGRDRESFKGYTGSLLDPLAAAEASANNTLTFLFDSERVTRIYNSSDSEWNLDTYYNTILSHVGEQSKFDNDITLMLLKVMFKHLMTLAMDQNINQQVSAISLLYAQRLVYETNLSGEFSSNYDKLQYQAHMVYLRKIIETYFQDPSQVTLPKFKPLPPGSPIGCH